MNKIKNAEKQYLQGIEKILDLCFFIFYKRKSFYRGIAQLVEHRSPKPRVVSSNLTAPATQDEDALRRLFSL